MENRFDFSKAQTEKIPCNLCGAKDSIVLERKEIDGIFLGLSICRQCGFLFLSPRLSKKDYDNYSRFFYRQHRADLKKIERPADIYERNFNFVKKSGAAIASKYKKWLDPRGLFLDVGSGSGGILAGFQEVFPESKVLGVEPLLEAAEFADNKGIKTCDKLFEDFAPSCQETFTTIVCIRSLNHLLDPRQFISWSFFKLREGGHLILIVKDFFDQCCRAGSVSGSWQVDHPFMFMPQTLKIMVESAGFKLISFEVDSKKNKKELNHQREQNLPIHHIWILAEKSGEIKKNPCYPNKNFYRKTRFLLSPIMVKIFYLIFYSKKVRSLLKRFTR